MKRIPKHKLKTNIKTFKCDDGELAGYEKAVRLYNRHNEEKICESDLFRDGANNLVSLYISTYSRE